MFYKKAQVGETMTWVVATIIIIVILLFSIFIASIKPGKDKDVSKLPDKQKDFIATKSIINFLTNNLHLLENSVKTKDYDPLDREFKPFLEELIIHRDLKGWNLQVNVNNKKIHTLTTFGIVGNYNCYDIILPFNLDSENVELRFWADFQGGCNK